MKIKGIAKIKNIKTFVVNFYKFKKTYFLYLKIRKVKIY